MRRLQRLRLRLGLTQQELAAEIGVDLNTIQRWEAGESFPWPRHLRRLYEVLSVAPDDLVEADEWPSRRTGKEIAAAVA